MKKLLLVLINFYQLFLSFDRGLLKFIAPGGACKYSPTCSQYTKQMINKFGAGKGLLLGAERIMSCR